MSPGRWVELSLCGLPGEEVPCAHVTLAGYHVCDPVGGSQAEMGFLVPFGLACSLLPGEKVCPQAFSHAGWQGVSTPLSSGALPVSQLPQLWERSARRLPRRRTLQREAPSPAWPLAVSFSR